MRSDRGKLRARFLFAYKQVHSVGDLQFKPLSKCYPVACSEGSHFELQKQVKRSKLNNKDVVCSKSNTFCLFPWELYQIQKAQ